MLSSRHICSKTAVSQMFGQPSEDLLEELVSQTMIKMSQ